MATITNELALTVAQAFLKIIHNEIVSSFGMFRSFHVGMDLVRKEFLWS